MKRINPFVLVLVLLVVPLTMAWAAAEEEEEPVIRIYGPLWSPADYEDGPQHDEIADWIADQISAEGLVNRQERFRAAGERLKSGFSALGFTPTADPRIASPVLTELRLPDGRSAADLRAYYLKEHNIMVGRGQGPETDPADSHIRVAHFGRSAEPERIDRLIEITRDFIA